MPVAAKTTWESPSGPNVRLFTRLYNQARIPTNPQPKQIHQDQPRTLPGLMKSTIFIIPELLSQIFDECLSGWDDRRDESVPSTDDAPLKLGRVCSLWRQITLSTPALWDSIHIEIYEYANGKRIANADTKVACKAQVFLERSGSRPVSIWLLSRSSEAMALITEELLLHIPRWKSLLLIIPMDSFEPFITTLARGAPSLQSLDVRLSPRFAYSLPLSLETTPCLSHLSCNSPILITPSRPLPQMCYLETGGNVHDLVHWLKHCPALEKLSYTFHSRHNESINDNTAIQLPLLKMLKLAYGYSCPPLSAVAQAQLLVDRLWVPTLRSLSLYHLETTKFTHLDNFLRRVASSLENLMFDFCESFSSDGDIAILSIVPTLHKLTIYDSSNNNKLVEALTCQPSSRTARSINTPLCPQLCQIKIGQSNGLSESALVDMISSRCGDEACGPSSGVYKLEKIVIIDDSNKLPDLQDHPVIVNCVLHGLCFEVGSFWSLKY